MTETTEYLSHGEIEDPKAIISARKLKQWMNTTGRQFILLDADDLIDALEAHHGWPAGAELFQKVVYAYRAHRASEAEQLPDGSMRGKTDVLTLDEMQEAQRWLTIQIAAKEAEANRLAANVGK